MHHDLGGSGVINYQWMRSGVIINGADSNTYTVQSTDVGSIFTLIVSRSDNSGFVTSLPTKMIPIEMVQIPGGILSRWSSYGWQAITLTAFKMGKYEITMGFYEAIMGINPSHFNSSSPTAGEIHSKRPVEFVTWYDAIEFCNKLSETEGITSVYTITGRTPAVGYPITSATITANWENSGYRLPTEMQWEYACRAGTTTNWHFGNTESDYNNYAWGSANSNNRTHQVGLKQPNAFGLYDMYGNVSEWCWDWLDAFYNLGDQTDPTGPPTTVSSYFRTLRGGSWYNSFVYSDSRTGNYPNIKSGDIGFRVVRP